MRVGKERSMIAACLCLLAMLWIVPRSAEGSTEGQMSAESIVSQYTNRTDKPPEWGHYKKWSTDALLMGNGDMGLAETVLPKPGHDPAHVIVDSGDHFRVGLTRHRHLLVA